MTGSIDTGMARRDPQPSPWHSHGALKGRRSSRLLWVDLLRGAALVGMIAYHGAWDLHAFGMSSVDPGTAEGWRLLGRGVAALFLALSGFSLSLAAGRGRSNRAVLLRLLRVAGAASLVSVVTWWFSPGAPIWFGILHCIVVTNVIAIGLRRLSPTLLLAGAAAAWVAPLMLSGTMGPAWAWTGLAGTEPLTLDFRPVLPWLAPVLVGLSLGKSRMSRWSWTGGMSTRLAGCLSWAGRHSLGIYLIHQPLMLAGLMALTHGAGWHVQPLRGLHDPGQARAFLRQCRMDCGATGGDDALCRSSCNCVLTKLALGGDDLSSGKDVTKADIAGAVAACGRGDHDSDR